MNKIREKIQNGEKIKGTLVCLTDPCLCEIVGNVGFDCVWIDTEHTYMSYKDVLCHLNAARSANIASLVRLPQNDLTSTKKILEMGPDAILFPMVSSLDEFNSLMEMTLYPPHGKRGFGPMRAIDYCAQKAVDYVEKKNFEMCRFVQIESITMIDELEEIAKNPYIDGFIFGPNDLSGAAGEFLKVFGEPTVREIERAMAIIRKHGKIAGMACGNSPDTLRFWSRFGFDMTFAGGDWNFLYDQNKATLDLLKQIEEEN